MCSVALSWTVSAVSVPGSWPGLVQASLLGVGLSVPAVGQQLLSGSPGAQRPVRGISPARPLSLAGLETEPWRAVGFACCICCLALVPGEEARAAVSLVSSSSSSERGGRRVLSVSAEINLQFVCP